MTVILAVALFAESALRAVVVTTNSAADVAALSLSAQIPSVVVLVLFLVAVRLLVPRASREVDSFMPVQPCADEAGTRDRA